LVRGVDGFRLFAIQVGGGTLICLASLTESNKGTSVLFGPKKKMKAAGAEQRGVATQKFVAVFPEFHPAGITATAMRQTVTMRSDYKRSWIARADAKAAA